MRSSVFASITPLAVALALGASACSSDAAPSASTSTPAPSATSSAPAEESATPSEDSSTESAPTDAAAAAAPGEFVTADIAKPVTNPGEKLTTIDGGGFTVDVYQVGVEKATKDGLFADPETNKPIIAKGDDIVFVNYVVTNTSGKDILLSNLFAKITARYADWPYLQGMDTVTDLDLYKKLDINEDAIALDAGEAPYVWKPGTSYSYGENFRYQKGSELILTVSLTPADAEGELDFDNATDEVEATTTIK